MTYVDRSLAGRWPRRTALVLALFFGSFSSVHGAFNVLGDLSPVFLTWGYVFGVMALAAMVAALVVYGEARARGRRLWLPGLLGAVASTLASVERRAADRADRRRRGSDAARCVAGRGRMAGPDGRRISREVASSACAAGGPLRGISRERWVVPAVALAGTALPLLYYAVLVKTDISWNLAQQATKHSFPF